MPDQMYRPVEQVDELDYGPRLVHEREVGASAPRSRVAASDQARRKDPEGRAERRR
jgi:hypothetical protein